MNLLHGRTWLSRLRGSPTDAGPDHPQTVRARQQHMADKGRRHSLFSLRHHDRPAHGARLPNAVACFIKSPADSPRLARSASIVGAGRSSMRDGAAAPPSVGGATHGSGSIRRRSIPAFAQLLSKRASFLHLGSDRPTPEAPAPEAMAHRGAVLRRAISSRWERLTKDAGESTGSHSGSSAGSARDSDDTLTAKAKAAVPAAVLDKDATSGGSSLCTMHADCTDEGANSDAECVQARAAYQRIQFSETEGNAATDTATGTDTPAEPTPGAQGEGVSAGADPETLSAGPTAQQQGAEHAARAETRDDSGAPETVDGVGGRHLLPAERAATMPTSPRQGRKLKLHRRWADTDNRYTGLATVRSTFAGLTATMDRLDGGRSRARSSSNSPTPLSLSLSAAAAVTAGASRILRARHSIIGGSTLGSTGAASASPEPSARRSMQAHGRLSLAPLPSEVERARMDAWVEDDDEFSPGDYDLSGAYYELGPKSASAYHAASAGASDTAYGGVPRPERQSAAQQLPPEKQDDSKCRTPESRMSSTSTVVDGGTLDPEQCKQIFLSSARKLQWSSRRREMSTVVHIRNAMARASEQYAAASGGRVLDPCPEARRLAADFCAYGGATPVIAHQQRDGMMLPAATAPAAAIAAATESPAPRRAAEREVAHSGGQLPARIRSMDCLPLLLQMARQGPEMRGDSGEPVYDGAHWAGAGDLVSLDPGGRSRPRTAYRPYPRRRGSRRSSACLGSAFVLAEAVVAQP